MEWIASNGTAISLNSLASGVVFTDPPEGLMMPPALITAAPVFNRPGQVLEQITFGERTVTVHLAVLAESLDDFIGLYSYFASLCNPRLGIGQLRVTRDDGTSRVLDCVYAGGLEGIVPIGEDKSLPDNAKRDVWAEADVDFTAFDPYFQDATATESQYGTIGTSTWFPLDLAAGLDLSSSAIFGETLVTNAGDDLAWPTWIIRGPATNPTLANVSTGSVMEFTSNDGLTLLEGETLVIDTLAGTVTKLALDGLSYNAWGTLSPASDLWPIVGGTNLLHLLISSASSVSKVSVSYRLRWLTI